MPNVSPFRKVAVVVFNLGGPDCPEAVRPFLFNLFNDPAILRVPGPVRFLLAHLIARRRAGPAGRIYERLGGKSPLLDNTQAQARVLESALSGPGGVADAVRVFIAMRYWHPMADEVAQQVKDYDPDRVVLLPLYPQWSTTTSASSIRSWSRAAEAAALIKPTSTVCCYPTEPEFIQAMTALIRPRLAEARHHGAPRILFSAHGLPRKVVTGGDPYQWQCERTALAIVAALDEPGLDWVNCYQSRIGPLEWIGPATAQELERAARDRVPVVLVPIAFVSEHSETLVELDIEYRHLAEEKGVPFYARVPTVGIEPSFIAGAAAMVRKALQGGPDLCSQEGGRICPVGFSGCPQRRPRAKSLVSH